MNRAWANKRAGFTLMEIMIAVLIVGIICVFTIPQYSKSTTVQSFRDARNNLLDIYSANRLYMAKTGHYYPSLWDPTICTGATCTLDLSDPAVLDAFNTALSLSITTQAGGATYTCGYTSAPIEQCTATLTGPPGFTLILDQNQLLSEAAPKNPSCSDNPLNYFCL